MAMIWASSVNRGPYPGSGGTFCIMNYPTNITALNLKSVHKAILKLESTLSRLISRRRPSQSAVDHCRTHSGVGVRFGIETVLVDIFARFLSSIVVGMDKNKLLEHRERLNEVGPHTLDAQVANTRVLRNSGPGFGLGHIYVSCVSEAAAAFGLESCGLKPLSLEQSVQTLNRDSSSGFPHFRRQSILIDGGQLLKEASKAFANPTSILELPTTLWTRAQLRLSGPKQRFVWGFPGVVKAIEQCLAFPLATAMRRSEHYCSGLEMQDYGDRIESLRNKSEMTISLDFESFDQSIKSEHVYCFFAMITETFQLPQTWVRMTSVI